jgi:dienelactone hydrolase
MRFLTLAILLALASNATPESFTFASQGKTVEGVISPAAGTPKALILYFHRGIEDRNAVLEWGKLLSVQGYAIAGYTAGEVPNAAQEAADEFKALRSQKRFASLPIVAMGASLGTAASAALFASSPDVRGLILLVPTSTDVCNAFQKASGRPVMLIQAENDTIAADRAPLILKCFPKNESHILLAKTPHRFPPSQVSTQILSWLQSHVSH